MPRVIIDGLLDVFFFFRDPPPPNGGSCLAANAEEILRKGCTCAIRSAGCGSSRPPPRRMARRIAWLRKVLCPQDRRALRSTMRGVRGNPIL